MAHHVKIATPHHIYGPQPEFGHPTEMLFISADGHGSHLLLGSHGRRHAAL